MDKKWHFTKDEDYPKAFGGYLRDNYPQIPCLVVHGGMYCVRYWNCFEECWDDEECDDYFCDKDAVEKWMYIDALEEIQ